MGWLKILTSIAPFVVQMVGVAEKAFDGEPHAGSEKKEFVMNATESVVGAVTSVSTGGQAETWQALSGPIGYFVDAACSFLFQNE